MGQERLTGLALKHIHYEMELDLNEIINIFARNIHVEWYCQIFWIISDELIRIHRTRKPLTQSLASSIDFKLYMQYC